MHGSINFRRGDLFSVQVHLTYKNSFLVHNLFYRSPMVTFKTIIFRGSRGIFIYLFIHFFLGGGGGCLFPIETHITCDFPGGPDPISLYLEVDIFF